MRCNILNMRILYTTCVLSRAKGHVCSTLYLVYYNRYRVSESSFYCKNVAKATKIDLFFYASGRAKFTASYSDVEKEFQIQQSCPAI